MRAGLQPEEQWTFKSASDTQAGAASAAATAPVAAGAVNLLTPSTSFTTGGGGGGFNTHAGSSPMLLGKVGGGLDVYTSDAVTELPGARFTAACKTCILLKRATVDLTLVHDARGALWVCSCSPGVPYDCSSAS